MEQNLAALVLDVMDKEPTLLQTCLFFGAIGSVGFLVGRWKRWLSLLAFAVSVVFALGLYEELSDRMWEKPSFGKLDGNMSSFHMSRWCLE